MKILGVDPGTATVGWAVVETLHAVTKPLAFGSITTPKQDAPEKRLSTIYSRISGIIDKYAPQILSLEELFFSTNVKTAISVGQARGVVLLSAAEHGIPVVSYSPLTVKLAVTGDGRAEKNQVQRMVQMLLHLSSVPKPDDTADALAIALTHAFSYRTGRKFA